MVLFRLGRGTVVSQHILRGKDWSGRDPVPGEMSESECHELASGTHMI